MADEHSTLLGISTLVDYRVPLFDLLEKITDAGFSAVAFGHRLSHFPYFDKKAVTATADYCAKLGLAVDYVHAPIDISLDLSSPNEHVCEATVSTYKFTIDAAKELGARAVTAHLSNADCLSAEEIRERARIAEKPIFELTDYARKKGIFFCLENMPHPYAYQRLLEAVLDNILNSSNPEEINLCIDTCHISIHNPDPFKFIETFAPYFRTTHLSDNFGARDIHLPPYSGNFDFDRLAEIMAKSGYDGNVMLENSYEAAVGRFSKGINSPEEPKPTTLEDYLLLSLRSAERFRKKFLSARKALAS